HSLRVRLAEAGYSVLDLKQHFDFADDDIRLIASLSDPQVIIIEELYRNRDVITKLCFSAPNAIVITSPRTSLFDLRESEAEEILHKEFIEFNLNALDAIERNELVLLANQNGLWGDLSAGTDRIKDRFLQDRCGNEVRSFLLHLFESPEF